jgi:glycerophosphoryl diester phosphodiesterase
LNLRRADGRVLRIGHKGVPALEPENTLRSLERAVGLGVDLVEFDVLDLEDGTLVLAHSDDLREVSHGAADGRVRGLTLGALRRSCPELPTLDEALDLLARTDVGLQIDLKWIGYEASAVEAVRRHGLVGRVLVSTCHASSLRAVAALEPALARGLTYPFDRFRLSQRQLLAPAVAATLLGLRRTLPARIGRLLERARASAAVLHHWVVSPAAVARCHARGAAVLAWTVDEPAIVQRMVAAGVDAIVTNDARILQS